MELNGSKVLLTGGTGFLGHHVVNALLAKGAKVALILQPHEKTWRIEGIRDQLELHEASLLDQEATKKATDAAKPDAVIHFAGNMERRRDTSILDDLTKHHVMATVNLMRSLDSEVTKIAINTGTSEEYGEQQDPFKEDMPIDPVSPYSATKAAATSMVTYISKAIGIPIVTMRPFITYGPAQLHDTLIPFMIKNILAKKTAGLTEGTQYRDFVYVDDLVSCYLAAIEKSENITKPEILNIGAGQNNMVRDVIINIADHLDGHDYIKLGAREMRAGEAPSMIADISKAKELIGWEPKVSLRDGLKKTVDWWLEHKEFWN